MNDKFLSLLGLARKASKFSGGHDAAFEAIVKKKAAACFIATDASDRLKDEFFKTTVFEDRNIPCIELPYTMNDIWAATHSKAAVFTVNDAGFARKLIELSKKEDK